MHGFDEFYGNLYHLNAEDEPEQPDYPREHPALQQFFKPRGVLDCKARMLMIRPKILASVVWGSR